MPPARALLGRASKLLIALLIAGLALFWWSRPPLPDWRTTNFGLDGTAASVFAPDKLLVFEFLMHPRDLQYMQDHAKDEVSVPAHVDVGTEHVGLVGLRFKGSTGTLDSVLAERKTDSFMPKLSLKIEFAKFVKGKRFHSLKKINLHSMVYDESLMRERICYQVFREAGVPAPRCSHAMVVINGQNMGIYAMVEQIDAAFINDRFATETGGMLYKEAWPIAKHASYYEKRVSKNPVGRSHDTMTGFAKALLAAKPSELPTVASRYTNLDRLLRYFIVDAALKNWDGVRGWTSRTAEGQPWNHNYYWYVSPKQQLTLIPWDLDSTLHHPSRRDNLRAWHDLRDPEQAGHATDSQWFAWTPASDRLTRAVAMHARGRYREVARELLDGPLDLEHLLTSIDTWRDQIRATVAHDPFLSGLGSWQSQLDELRADLRAIREDMENELRQWDDTMPASLR